MGWLHQFRLRFNALLRRRQLDRDLEDELQFHLAMREQRRAAEGIGAVEARTQARRELGNTATLKERCREMWTFVSLETVWQDFRYGFRMLRRNPAFTSVAVLSLALGIGANSALFSVMDALFLKTLPVENPEELVAFRGRISYPAYQRIRDTNHVFSGMLAVDWYMPFLSIIVDGQAERATGQMVSGNYFSVLGVGAVLGRTLIPDDDRVIGAGGTQGAAAVISHAFWQRRFGLNPSIVGKQISVNDVPVTIVGVTPPGFFGIQQGLSPDITVPVSLQPRVAASASTALWLNGHHGSYVDYDESDDYNGSRIIARLKPDVPAAQAQAEVDTLFQQILAARAGTTTAMKQRQDSQDKRIELAPAGNGIFTPPAPQRRLLFVSFMTMPGIVLLIACANVANLLLARASARQKEVAVRMAIGAGRFRLIRQLLTESALIALAGAIAGVLLSIWGRKALLALLANQLFGGQLSAETDARMLGFTLAVAVVSGILFGLAPAFRATRPELTPALKSSSLNRTGRGSRWELGKLLVVSQVALSLLLLVSAGLFVRTVENFKHFDPGYGGKNLLLFTTHVGPAGYKGPRTGILLKELLGRVSATPGVRTAGASQYPPVNGDGLKVSVEGYVPQSREDEYVQRFQVAPGFFEATGIPLIAGRDITWRDNESAAKVGVISQAAAQTLFSGINPVGRRLTFLRAQSSYEVEIIGVAKDVRQAGTMDRPWRGVYCPMLQDLPIGNLSLEVRAAADPASVVAEVRHAVQGVDRNLVFEVRTMDDSLGQAVAPQRVMATLASCVGALALLLASVGLYGVMAYMVARRTNEIGIRMALGAERPRVIWMVLREAMVLAGAGIIIGLPLAWAASRLISSQLSGLTPTDPLTNAAAIAIMIAVALLAGYLPARRAARVDPVLALRNE